MSPSDQTTTLMIDRSNVVANSKSRMSWPGTPTTAPVPKFPNTKSEIRIGIFHQVSL